MFSFFSVLLGLWGHASPPPPSSEPIFELYKEEKQKIIANDQASRQVMGNLYQINQRMKLLSKKRSALTDSIIASEGKVRSLSKNVVELETKIKKQRKNLSKRLKAIYMFGDDAMARILFSSASAQDLDQSLKYLKIISEHDYKNIKNFESALNEYQRKKQIVKKEVRTLLGLKNKMNQQESLLEKEQNAKSAILGHLDRERVDSLKKIQSIRTKGINGGLDESFDISFYEQKGILQPPVFGDRLQDYGLIENPTYKYQLSHKGLRFLARSEDIMAVYKGRVAFTGHVFGYGQTTIIDHGDHYYSVYAGAKKILIQEGERVEQNMVIAKANTEVYFEIRHFSDAIDPNDWLKVNDVRARD